MLETHWYLLTVATLIIMASGWATLTNHSLHTSKERLHFLGGTVLNCIISATAYWMLVFVLALVIAAGIWLFLLLLVWVPSDFFQNYFGADVFAKALKNIKPAIYTTYSSPGITHIPLLDYVSLTAAYILGPWLGVRSILNQGHTPPAHSNPQPQS